MESGMATGLARITTSWPAPSLACRPVAVADLRLARLARYAEHGSLVVFRGLGPRRRDLELRQERPQQNEQTKQWGPQSSQQPMRKLTNRWAETKRPFQPESRLLRLHATISQLLRAALSTSCGIGCI